LIDINIIKYPFKDNTEFNDSTILTNEAYRRFVLSLFIGYIFNAKMKRLYRATANGFSAAQFHALCNDKGPTLSLIRTTAGHIFGGFTTISWDSSCSYKNDTHSFLFSVDKQIKFPIV
jgi:hypothetical protein